MGPQEFMKGVYMDAKKWAAGTKAGKELTQEGGERAFQRTINEMPGIQNAAIRHALRSGGLPQMMFKKNAVASEVFNRSSMINSMMINAGIGGAVGGLTDQDGVGHGIVKGAFGGVALGVGARGAAYGAMSILNSEAYNETRAAAQFVSANKVKGLYMKYAQNNAVKRMDIERAASQRAGTWVKPMLALPQYAGRGGQRSVPEQARRDAAAARAWRARAASSANQTPFVARGAADTGIYRNHNRSTALAIRNPGYLAVQ